MGRIIGVLAVIVGLFIAQSVYDFYLSWNYTEVEAILIAYEEDCYFEKDRSLAYFDFPLLGFKPPSSDGDWLQP
jgi:hypothetical protein